MSPELLELLRHPASLAVLGALVGSFLNVVIHRLPLRLSLWRPGSRCPRCRHPVAPWDNVPVVSWLLLAAKCRHCREPIPVRYPLVEVVTAVLFALAGVTVSDPVALPFTLLFLAAMVVVTFIDLDHMIIPDSITLPGIAVGLGAAFLGAAADPVQALMGIVVGAGGLLAVAAGYRAVTGREGLGGGDVKLLGMVGAFLGPAGAFLTIMIGALAGTLWAYVFVLRRGGGRTTELPFGTFLAPGAVVVLFCGTWIVDTYRGLFS